jgi:hypothetical protein
MSLVPRRVPDEGMDSQSPHERREQRLVAFLAGALGGAVVVLTVLSGGGRES